MEERARDWWNAWADQFQTEYGGGEIKMGIDWGPSAPKGDDLGVRELRARTHGDGAPDDHLRGPEPVTGPLRRVPVS